MVPALRNDDQGPCYCIYYEIWEEIIYPFPNFNGKTLKFGNG